MNYLQILTQPLSILKSIDEPQYFDLLVYTRRELLSLQRMQSSELDPNTFRSRGNVISRLKETQRVLEAHALYSGFVSRTTAPVYAYSTPAEPGKGKSVAAKALKSLRSSQSAQS